MGASVNTRSIEKHKFFPLHIWPESTSNIAIGFVPKFITTINMLVDKYNMKPKSWKNHFANHESLHACILLSKIAFLRGSLVCYNDFLRDVLCLYCQRFDIKCTNHCVSYTRFI